MNTIYITNEETMKPVPPTAKAPVPPTANGFHPTPFRESRDVLKPTPAIAVPSAYFDTSFPKKSIVC